MENTKNHYPPKGVFNSKFIKQNKKIVDITIVKEIYMLQLLPQNKTLIPDSYNPTEIIDFVNNYIDNYSCENLDIDISFINIMDACHISTICSTIHYIKYPQGKINWKVSSEKVKEFAVALSLGNVEYKI